MNVLTRDGHTELFRRDTFNGSVNSFGHPELFKRDAFIWRVDVSAILSSSSVTRSVDASTRAGHSQLFRRDTFNDASVRGGCMNAKSQFVRDEDVERLSTDSRRETALVPESELFRSALITRC